MLLERPDPVVTDDAHDRDLVTNQGVELHRRKTESAVAGKQDHLLVWVRELRRHRVARAGAKAAKRAWVEPESWFLTLDQSSRKGHEVPAVADQDRVRVAEPIDLRHQAGRM